MSRDENGVRWVAYSAMDGVIELGVVESSRVEFRTRVDKPVHMFGLHLFVNGSYHIDRGSFRPIGSPSGYRIVSSSDAIGFHDNGEYFMRHLKQAVEDGIQRTMAEFARPGTVGFVDDVVRKVHAEVFDRIGYVEYLRKEGRSEFSEGFSESIRKIEAIDTDMLRAARIRQSVEGYVLMRGNKLVRLPAPEHRAKVGWFSRMVSLHYGSAYSNRRLLAVDDLEIVRVEIRNEIISTVPIGEKTPEVLSRADEDVIDLAFPEQTPGSGD